jgi:hypothetical protein
MPQHVLILHRALLGIVITFVGLRALAMRVNVRLLALPKLLLLQFIANACGMTLLGRHTFAHALCVFWTKVFLFVRLTCSAFFRVQSSPNIVDSVLPPTSSSLAPGEKVDLPPGTSFSVQL